MIDLLMLQSLLNQIPSIDAVIRRNGNEFMLDIRQKDTVAGAYVLIYADGTAQDRTEEGEILEAVNILK